MPSYKNSLKHMVFFRIMRFSPSNAKALCLVGTCEDLISSNDFFNRCFHIKHTAQRYTSNTCKSCVPSQVKYKRMKEWSWKRCLMMQKAPPFHRTTPLMNPRQTPRYKHLG